VLDYDYTARAVQCEMGQSLVLILAQ